ncbi:MAG: hypothetical protein JWO42_2376 [Chloroflexi bacterium]|nr:hypothetical protein [Chloroflexota bacterium]
MRLWGREYTRIELMQRVGRLAQIGGVDAVTLDDGPERGVRALQFRSAAGLSCLVVPDRGMDIADFSWNGRSLCWHNAPGRVSPALFVSEEKGFLRSFFGGMLTTCGLTNFGPGGEEAGEQLFMHGLASNLPASAVAWGERWDGDRCTIWARGTTRQTKLFGENLTLTRSLELDLDGATLRLEDVVRNEGWDTTPHMIMYHNNAGFPLLDEGARLLGKYQSVTPRDADAARGLQGWDEFQAPQAGFKEQVFIVQPEPDQDGWTEVTLWNANLEGGLGLKLRWDATTLPWMCVWRMLGQGAYVLGIEPINCPTVTGRADARANGTLPMLAPGEEVRYRLEYSVVTSSPS